MFASVTKFWATFLLFGLLFKDRTGFLALITHPKEITSYGPLSKNKNLMTIYNLSRLLAIFNL